MLEYSYIRHSGLALEKLVLDKIMNGDKKTILIAEDEADLLEMYNIALSNRGYEVLVAVNGAETMEWLEKRYSEIDVILLDIVMPKMDGFEALKKIKADDRFRKIKVIIFTNLDNEEDKKQAFEMGASDYFVKSQYTPSELVEKIDLLFLKNKGISEN
jgi:DNA-binding response OmpR family regulator